MRRILIALLVPLLALFACGGDDGEAEVSDTVVRPDSSGTEAEDEATEDDATEEDATEDDGSDSASFAAVLREAPERAAEASTGSVDLEMTMTIPEVGEVSFSGTGAFDDAAGQMEMEIDLGEMLSAIAEETGEEVPPGLDEPMQMVLDGDTMYMHIPAFQREIGAPWISVPVDDAAGAQIGAGANDPAALLEGLRGVSDDVQEIGQEQVRDVDTTRYAATIDFEQALEQLPPEERDRLESQFDQLGATQMPVEVWIDGDGLARRMEMRLDEVLAAGGTGGEALISMEFYDYGEPVDIQVPDPSETRPAEDIPGFDTGG